MALGREARALRRRDRRSQAAQDIMRQQRELAAAQMGVGAAARGPFAGATQQAAQRAVGASGAQAAAQAAAADLARLRQADEMMQQLQTQGEIQKYQEEQARKAAEEERSSMFGGGIGSAIGSGLGALGRSSADIDGERDYGVMAQDMPKDMVKEVGGVKTIPEGFGKLLAGMANLNDRIKKLEGK